MDGKIELLYDDSSSVVEVLMDVSGLHVNHNGRFCYTSEMICLNHL